MAVGTVDKPWDKRGQNHQGPFDTIVIGSGMGGMTTAALLAKAGERVLVLEQHYVPGGFTHVFNRPGYTWDVGVHAVGEVTEHSMLGRVLAYLTDGELEWKSLGPVYDEFYWPDGKKIDFPDSPQQFRQNLIEAFPDEVEAIDAYLRLVKEVAKAAGPFFVARTLPAKVGNVVERIATKKALEVFGKTAKEVLDTLTDNDQLKAVLASQWGYYGAVPSDASFAIQALVTRHFYWGGYYPVGGSQKIAQHLLQTVARAGGWTRISTDVDKILIENGRAVGVRLKKTGEEIRAKRVVSAAGVQSTVTRLLPESYQHQRWAKQVQELTPGPAHVCLYIGFKGDIREAGASGANKWFYETWSTEDEAWQVAPGVESDELPEAPILYCSFPSLKDPEHDPGEEHTHTGEVVTFVPWKHFEGWMGSRWKKRGGDYEEFKKALTDRMLKQLLKHMPELEPMIDYVELSTPLSTDKFTRPMKGSIYGLEPTPKRFDCEWLRPRSPIPGLFFSGSEVGTVGVMGAMLGGTMAALSIKPVEIAKVVASVRKR